MLFINIAIFSFSTLIMNVAFAQNIILTCISPLTKEWMDDFPKFNEERCLKNGKEYCDKRDEDIKKMQACVNSKLTYSHRRIYIFDKSILNSSEGGYAEVSSEACWEKFGTKRIKIIVTPSVITFKEEQWNFNIDRETIEGGWDTQRDWECSFKEVKSKNRL